MSHVLNWAKANIITVVSGVMILIAAVLYAVLVRPAAGGLQTEMGQASRELAQLRQISRGNVDGPARGTGKPLQIPRPVTAADVRQLGDIFREMNSGYRALYQFAVQFNQNNHRPLVEDLFPRQATDSILFRARTAYNRAFLNPNTGEDQVPGLYQQLGAGMPPTPEQIDANLKLLQTQFMNAPGRAGELVDAEKIQLAQMKAAAHRDMIASRASEVWVYAERPEIQAGTLVSSGVFDIGAWAQATAKPLIEEVWEGQMGLWIQQDLVTAINLAQFGGEPDPDRNVLQLPIKRIIRIELNPEYLGTSDNARAPTGMPTGMAVPGRPTATAAASQPDAASPLPTDYALSPTGRVSNALYDVRSAELSVIVDARHIPLLLNALTRVNFQTPILKRIVDIDEYNEFAAGYFYGQGVDVVQVDLTVESLWMRRWTAGQTDPQAIEEYAAAQPTDSAFNGLSDGAQKVNYLKQKGAYDMGLMPDPVRMRLGMAPRDPSAAAPEEAGRTGGAWSGPMGPGMRPSGPPRPR
jgi:hypothetical protein